MTDMNCAHTERADAFLEVRVWTECRGGSLDGTMMSPSAAPVSICRKCGMAEFQVPLGPYGTYTL